MSGIVHAGMLPGNQLNDYCGANDGFPVIKHCTDNHFNLKELE